MIEGMTALCTAPDTQTERVIAPAGNVSHDDGNNNNITPNLEHTQIVPGDETTPAVPPGGWRTRLALVWRSIF